MKKLAALLMILSLGLFTAVGCGETSQPKGGTTPPATGGKADTKAKTDTKATTPAPGPAAPAGEKK
jgi:hypothetical protein